MRKFVLLFCSAWLAYCFIQTGYAVTDPKWRQYLKQSPVEVQDESGDIFNQGARFAYKKGIVAETQTVTFATDLDSLKLLSYFYWLYPTHFVSSQSKTMKGIFIQPDTNVFYFIGKQETFESNLPYLNPMYSVQNVTTSDGNVFMIMRRK